ncbi:MAG: hypothetical protein Q7R34_01575 [Dehalococcoidia bacterium]|nr:hypothetical protein [Dehalococcoidia bacterium]
MCFHCQLAWKREKTRIVENIRFDEWEQDLRRRIILQKAEDLFYNQFVFDPRRDGGRGIDSV